MDRLRRHEVRHRERERASDETKTAAPGIHHQVTDPGGRGTSRPSVRTRRSTRTSLPELDQCPKAHSTYPISDRSWRRAHHRSSEPERQLDDPDDPETEHPEQHPGADRAGGGLPDIGDAAPGVQPQRREQHDLAEHPGGQEEPLYARRLVARAPCPNTSPGIDGRKLEAPRDGRPEEERIRT